MPTRRQLIKQASLLAAVAAMPALGLGSRSARAGEQGHWYLPDEGDHQQRAFMAFGAQEAIWEDFTGDVQQAQGRIARAIAAYQPLTLFLVSYTHLTLPTIYSV